MSGTNKLLSVDMDCRKHVWPTPGNTIKWNITLPQVFLQRELGAWNVRPIRINRLSSSPDIEVEFASRPDFANMVDEFLQSVGNTWQPPPTYASLNESIHGASLTSSQHSQDAQT